MRRFTKRTSLIAVLGAVCAFGLGGAAIASAGSANEDQGDVHAQKTIIADAKVDAKGEAKAAEHGESGTVENREGAEAARELKAAEVVAAPDPCDVQGVDGANESGTANDAACGEVGETNQFEGQETTLANGVAQAISADQGEQGPSAK